MINTIPGAIAVLTAKTFQTLSLLLLLSFLICSSTIGLLGWILLFGYIAFGMTNLIAQAIDEFCTPTHKKVS